MRKAEFNFSFQVHPSIDFTALEDSRRAQHGLNYKSNPSFTLQMLAPVLQCLAGKAFLYVLMCSGHMYFPLFSLAPGVIFILPVCKSKRWRGKDKAGGRGLRTQNQVPKAVSADGSSPAV